MTQARLVRMPSWNFSNGRRRRISFLPGRRWGGGAASLSLQGPQVQLGDQPVRKAGHGGNWQQGLGGASQALCVLSSSSSLWS